MRPSVVQIRTVGFGPVEGQPQGQVTSEQGTGSGFVLDSEGYIVTNAHVVRGARHIQVRLDETNLTAVSGSAGLPAKRSVAAQLIGMDQETDLAVIKIDRAGLAPLTLADSDQLSQGQIVLAFGNPMALEDSVSMGVVSSPERQLTVGDPYVYIQTDAPINPGNSGGPLVDAEGGVVGMNAFILSQSGGSEGIGFAIPSNLVKRIYLELRESGHIHHGRIGVVPISVTPSLAAGLRLPRDWGVILEDVAPDGPSQKAGLDPGDLLADIDGEPIRSLHQLLMIIDRHAIGDVIKVHALRGTETVEADVTVANRTDDPNRFLEMVTEKSNLVSRLGILAVDIDDSVLDLIGELRKPAGVLVAASVAGEPGAEDGLGPGDLIISLNGNPIFNLASLREILDKLQPGSPAVLQIQRKDQLRFVVLELS